MKKSRSKLTSSSPPATLESMAALAGGMADDFNNILTTVMGACSLIDRDDTANSELLHCVELIRASAEHAANLSRRLMCSDAMEMENASSDSPSQDSGADATSGRDKKGSDGIVLTGNNSGGASS